MDICNELSLHPDTTVTHDEERLRTTICIYSQGGGSKPVQGSFFETRAHGRAGGYNDYVEYIEHYHNLFLCAQKSRTDLDEYVYFTGANCLKIGFSVL
ncbi:hypothetical protein BofuT4_uP020090.1 [Botrytis cinerea T4]|uniref:Uncharacterized protein n=1 Tax=Botryotinia fuckeliana (strain T4) TaxID=999810 RepID=G2YJ16_BOTF4|nr:hypothetical protein BofuT4_uP020090.1 [Botrytis cinerea T4]